MKDGSILKEGSPRKDRSHYGRLLRDEILLLAPEQAARWLNTKPPPPIMWTRGAANNEKSARFAEIMRRGEWDNDLPCEPVMIWEDHQCVLGGHHRLTAVSMLDRPQELRVLFWTKPKGWDRQRRENPEATTFVPEECPICMWWAMSEEHVEAHIGRAHKTKR